MTRTSPIAFCRRSATTSTSAPYHGSSSAANVEGRRTRTTPPPGHYRAPESSKSLHYYGRVVTVLANLGHLVWTAGPAVPVEGPTDQLLTLTAASAGGRRLRSLRDALPGVVTREVLLAPPARDDPLATALDATGLVATLG